MKGPIDSTRKVIHGVVTEVVRKKRKPAGGKVLARMKQFAMQRNLPLILANRLIVKPVAFSKADPSAIVKSLSKSRAQVVSKNYARALSDSSHALGNNKPTRITTGSRGLQMRRTARTALSQWKFIGPSSITNGQTYGNSRVICSGRVADIAIDPGDSDHILVGSAGGGVWETRDRGATWEPRTDFMSSLKTGAIAFDRKDPGRVYWGTGEGNEPLGFGQGIFHSNDGGTHWALLCGEPFVGQDFFDLVIDHLQKGHMLAATNFGIYKSIDGGKNWTQPRSDNCWDLVISPAGGMCDPILAACTNGLYESKNGGDTFKKITLPFAEAKFVRLAVTISKSNPDKAYAFGVIEGANKASLWCRSIVGGAWKRYKVPVDLDVSQASYDWFLEVSPDNEDEIYIGAIEAYRGILKGTEWHWVKISNKRGDDIHPDHHCIAIDPRDPNRIYIGNDGGVFFSPDRGKNWESLNVGLGITEIVYLAQNLKTRNWLIAGTQDNGTIRYTGNLQWEQIADGDGGDCGVNQDTPEIYYHTYYGMGIERSAKRNEKLVWEWLGPDVEYKEGDIFYPPMEVHGNIVAQAGRSVFIIDNAVELMYEIPLPRGQVATAMFIPVADVIYVGTKKGCILKITWDGAEWSYPIKLQSLRPEAYISDLYVDPANLNRMWATSKTMDGHRCFRSDDEGASWHNCTPHATDLPINSIEVDPADPDRVWVAADIGVYQSLDAGATWTSLTNDLPNAIACDLIYNPSEKLLRVGLQNRGVWELDV